MDSFANSAKFLLDVYEKTFNQFPVTCFSMLSLNYLIPLFNAFISLILLVYF
jgi:hypothetical protein